MTLIPYHYHRFPFLRSFSSSSSPLRTVKTPARSIFRKSNVSPPFQDFLLRPVYCMHMSTWFHKSCLLTVSLCMSSPVQVINVYITNWVTALFLLLFCCLVVCLAVWRPVVIYKFSVALVFTFCRKLNFTPKMYTIRTQYGTSFVKYRRYILL